jgi:hypothetical protein
MCYGNVNKNRLPQPGKVGSFGSALRIIRRKNLFFREGNLGPFNMGRISMHRKWVGTKIYPFYRQAIEGRTCAQKVDTSIERSTLGVETYANMDLP